MSGITYYIILLTYIIILLTHAFKTAGDKDILSLKGVMEPDHTWGPGTTTMGPRQRQRQPPCDASRCPSFVAGGRADLLPGGCADAPEADQDPQGGGQREPQTEGQLVAGVLPPSPPDALPGALRPAQQRFPRAAGPQ